MSGPAVAARTSSGVWWLGFPDREAVALGPAPDVSSIASHAFGVDVRTVYVLGDVDELPAGVVEWRQVVGGVSLVAPALDEGRSAGLWDGLAPRELAAVFGQLARLLGVEWADGVGRTAEALILSTHPRAKGGAVLGSAPVVPDVCEDGTLEQPYASWVRRPSEREQAARWVHFFDANAQYLAAWQTVELGRGEPDYLAGDAAAARWAAGAFPVGFWRVPELARVPWEAAAPRLPGPVLPGREWFSTPSLRRAVELADDAGLTLPPIVEAWAWPARSRFLRGAGERLRDARAEARGRVALARSSLRAAVSESDGAYWAGQLVVADSVAQAVKALYTVQTGRFSMLSRDARSGWRRPDWGHLIRAQARANLHRRLCRLSSQPFAIATDGLVFASDEPDAVRFAAQLGLPLGDGLGAFRVDGTAHAGPVLAAAVEVAGRGGGVRPVWEAGRGALARVDELRGVCGG